MLSIHWVDDPERAQVLIHRRRPPLQADASGRLRASHGRSRLLVRQVDRGQGWRLEPLVVIDLSPDQRSQALSATALHELGHAFGLWGHSDDPQDVMAVHQGAQPVLELTARDRATILWLYNQPTSFGTSLPLADPGPAQPLPAAPARPPGMLLPQPGP